MTANLAGHSPVTSNCPGAFVDQQDSCARKQQQRSYCAGDHGKWSAVSISTLPHTTMLVMNSSKTSSLHCCNAGLRESYMSYSENS